jgi:uncharacterized SAM-binding protein YcdF (DUF218 family)
LRLAVVFGAAVLPGGRASPALARRTDHAAALVRARAVERVLVSGGLGRHPPSEARVMADRLVAAGVDPAAIARDETATTTMATARAVAAWCRAHPEVGEIVGVTDRWHAPRARLALWGHGVRARTSWPSPARLGVRARLRAWRREAVGLPVYAVRAVLLRLR